MEINIGNIVLEDELNFGNIELDIVKIYPELENLEVTPSKEEQTFKSENYYGYDEVKVNGVTSGIDTNIVPENIKEGVEILGVIGDYNNAKPEQEKIVMPNFSEGNMEIIPDNGMVLNKVILEKAEGLKPSNIKQGINLFGIEGTNNGADINDYFETTITNSNSYEFASKSLYKKLPTIIIDSSVTSLNRAFYQSVFDAIDIIGDTSNVTNMENFIYGNKKIKTLPLLNTSNVRTMRSAFSYCSNLETIPQYDTSNVVDMGYMLNSNNSLKTLPLLNTSNVADMNNICGSCSELISFPQWDTQNVWGLNYAFSYCKKLENFPKINASKIRSIGSIFIQCTALKNLGGFENLGQGFLTTQSANYSSYKFNLSSSADLTHESLMNVINNLYDIASAGIQPQQLVLGSTNMAKLTAEEIAIATNKGWSVS